MVSTPTSGLMACDECGAAHPLQQARGDGTTVRCPRCGSDAITELRAPSAL